MSISSNNKKKEELKRLTIEAISEECKKSSSQKHQELRVIAKGLEEGRELDLKILTGGLCNYSYKIHFKNNDEESEDENNDIALFAKLSFGNALLAPETSCSPERTNYEFKMMEMYAKISPNPGSIVTPYFCVDIEGSEENMKLLVTQFSSRLQEQAANIFIEGGVIDNALASNLAEGLSTLHNTKVTEKDFNEGMKDFFVQMTPMMTMTFNAYLDVGEEKENTKPDTAVSRCARAIGKERLDGIVKLCSKRLMQTDCYVHGDFHVFNVLVEESTEGLSNQRGGNGDVALVDWEMSHCGPMGKDIGWFHAFPMACILAHTINGDKSSSISILKFLDGLWDAYSESIHLDDKDNLSLADVYRQTLGFMGVLAQAYSTMGFHMNYLPIEEHRLEDLAKVKDSLGVVALKCLEMGFGGAEDMALPELRKRFKDTVLLEIDRLAPPEKRCSARKSRRSSLLRETGRRVSDAHSYLSLTSSIATEEFWDDVGDDGDAIARMDDSRRSPFALLVAKRDSIIQLERSILDMDYEQ